MVERGERERAGKTFQCVEMSLGCREKNGSVKMDFNIPLYEPAVRRLCEEKLMRDGGAGKEERGKRGKRNNKKTRDEIAIFQLRLVRNAVFRGSLLYIKCSIIFLTIVSRQRVTSS